MTDGNWNWTSYSNKGDDREDGMADDRLHKVFRLPADKEDKGGTVEMADKAGTVDTVDTVPQVHGKTYDLRGVERTRSNVQVYAAACLAQRVSLPAICFPDGNYSIRTILLTRTVTAAILGAGYVRAHAVFRNHGQVYLSTIRATYAVGLQISCAAVRLLPAMQPRGFSHHLQGMRRNHRYAHAGNHRRLRSAAA